MYRNEEKEINLTDMCLYMLRQWKVVVIAAIVLALAVGGFSYIKSYRAYEASKNVTPSQVAKEVKLSDSEKEALQAKIDLINEHKENIAEYNYYLNNSISVKMNPNQFYRGTIKYIFSADDNTELIRALELCWENVLSEENYEALALMLTEDTDVTMLKEVISFDEDANETILLNQDIREPKEEVSASIVVKHYNQEECEKMVAFYAEEMERMSTIFAKKAIDAEIELVASGVKSVSDRDLITLSKEIQTAKSNAYDAIAKIEDNMTDTQKEYYSLSQMEETENTETEKAEVKVNVEKPSMDLKLVVIGAVAGAFCVLALYAVLYLFSNRVHNKEELESWLNIPVFDWEAGAEMVATLLAGVAQKNDTKHIYLTGSVPEVNSEFAVQLKDLLAKEQIELKIGDCILSNAKAVQEAAECGYVVFAEKCNVSKDKDIREGIDKLVSCGVKVVGVVLEK